MLNIVYNHLKNVKTSTFKELLEVVKEKMKVEWKERFPSQLLKDVQEEKAAELYTLLSIDGRFIRDKENRWALIEKFTYEEVKHMRVNIGENVEEVEE